MNLRRAAAISTKTFLSLKHDKRSLGLMLVAPIMAMLVFGFAFGAEVSDVKTLVINQDEGEEAAAFIAQLDHDALDIEMVTDEAAARARVLDTEATALLVFPANFTVGVTPVAGSSGTQGPAPGVGGTAPTPPGPPPGTTVTVFVDSTNNQLALVVQRALVEAAKDYAESKGTRSPIQVESNAAYAEGARYIDYFVPGIMGFAALMFTTLLTLLAFVGERTSGTLDRLRVTPATEGEIVLGYTMAFGVVGAVQGVLLLGAAILLFDVLVVGNVLLAAAAVILLAIDAMAIGILVSSAAQREGQAVQFFPFIALPTFLLSGIFVPVESLPVWLQPVAYALPPTWAIEALRNVMLRGWGFDQVWLHLLVLAVFAVAFAGLAVLGLRKSRA